MPKISVVIPVYNIIGMIKETINFLLLLELSAHYDSVDSEVVIFAVCGMLSASCALVAIK